LISAANYLNLFDYPDSKRKIHNRPIPFVGGLAIFMVTSLIPYLIIKNPFVNMVIFYGFFIFILGLIDDIFGLNAIVKLIFQILIVFFFVKELPQEYWINFFVSKNLNLFSTLFWMIFVINSINLIDGVDGLAAGLSFIVFTSILSVAIQNSYKEVILYCIVVSANLAAFLRFNIPPAKIFLGDSGSLYLGFIISAMSLLIYSKTVVSFSFLMPVLFLIIPLLDVIRVAFKRAKNKKNIFKADKEHIHHKLMDMGFTDRQILLLLYFIACIISITTLKNYMSNLKIIALVIIIAIYGMLLLIKLVQPFDFKKKLKRTNYLIRRFIRKLVQGKENYQTKSRSLLIINIITIMSIIFLYILFYKTENWNIDKSLIFILLILIVLTNQMFINKDDTAKIFSNFIMFWIYFYIIFQISKNFYFSSNILSMVLFILILFRTLIKKQFDLLIYNPLEILIIHVIIILLLAINEVNTILILKSFIVYYSTKNFFIKENREYKIFVPITVMLLSIGPFLTLLQNIR